MWSRSMGRRFCGGAIEMERVRCCLRMRMVALEAFVYAVFDRYRADGEWKKSFPEACRGQVC